MCPENLFWNHSIKKWSDITSLSILNDNIMSFLDVFSTKKWLLNRHKFRNPRPPPPYSGNFPKLYQFLDCFPLILICSEWPISSITKKQQMSSVSPFFKELGQKEAAKLQGWLTLKASLDFLPGLSFVP